MVSAGHHTGIGLIDYLYLITVTAQSYGLKLVKPNIKHFPMFDDLKSPFQP